MNASAKPAKLVVGAAIVRDGRLLATRRTTPPQACGLWELPGGKVEPGERPDDAVVREIHEELGCVVRVTGTLDGHEQVGHGFTLGVLRAELVAGEPTPHEHDALRWLGPDELHAVTWLPPDVPFVAQVRELLLRDAD